MARFRDEDDDLELAALAYGMGMSLEEVNGEDVPEDEVNYNEEGTLEEDEEDEASRFIQRDAA